MRTFTLPYSLILGSKSPRRQQLLRDLGFSFTCRSADIEESYPPHLREAEIAEYLAVQKAQALQPKLQDRERVLTSDTVVWCKGESLAKASNAREARIMLQKMSGREHTVITAICLASRHSQQVLHDAVKVFFNPLDEEVIEHYITNYEPFDKAGAYGIQEWIGMWGIRRIEGSYFTVMGLPTHLVGPLLLEEKGRL